MRKMHFPIGTGESRANKIQHLKTGILKVMIALDNDTVVNGLQI